MRESDRTAGVLLLLFALFVISQSVRLPFWMQNAPGPGFVPLSLGGVLALAALALLVRRTRDTAEAPPDPAQARRVAAVTGMAAVTALLVYPLGMALSSGVFVAAVLFYLTPARRLGNVLAALLTPAIVWLVFMRWLSVPLPRGPFGF